MKQWRLHFPIKIMSRLFSVSRSGYYTWLKRKPSRRTQKDERLKVAIKAAHKRTRESYSARRLQPELAEARMERDILKKATAYFARESLPGTRS